MCAGGLQSTQDIPATVRTRICVYIYIYIYIYMCVRICICVYTCTCVLHRMLGNVARWLEFPFYQSPQSVPFMCAQAMSASEVHVGVVMYGSDKLVLVVFQTHRR